MTYKKGDKIRLFFGEGNSNNCILHIRAVVDRSHIVFKQWSRFKKRWNYQVESISWFDAHKEYCIEARRTY